MSIQYSIQIVWSQEDGAYVAFPAELPGCIADGQTPEEALANLKVIISEWVETATEEKRQIPKPMSVEDFAREHQKASVAFQKQIQQQIQQEVATAVKHLFSQFVQQQPATYFHRRVATFTQSKELEIA